MIPVRYESSTDPWPMVIGNSTRRHEDGKRQSNQAASEDMMKKKRHHAIIDLHLQARDEYRYCTLLVTQHLAGHFK